MKKTQKTQCQPFNCLLATHPFEIWHSGFPRVCRISQSQLVNSLLATHPFKIWHSGFSRILNIFQSQLVNSQKRHTISQNQSLEKKIKGLMKELRKSNVNLSTAFWRHTHLKFGPLDFPESVEFSKVNLSTTKSDVPFSGIRISREKNKRTQEKNTEEALSTIQLHFGETPIWNLALWISQSL